MNCENTYIDKQRLNSYFEQICSSPVAYDKVSSWTAKAGITGIGAEGNQTLQPRPFTDHEKITMLTEYLENSESFIGNLDSVVEYVNQQVKDSGYLNYSFKENFARKPFHLVKIKAIKVLIPPSDEAFPRGMTIWFAAGRPSSSLLRPDNPSINRRHKDLSFILLQDSSIADQGSQGRMTMGSPYHDLTEVVSNEFIRESVACANTSITDELCRRTIRYLIVQAREGTAGYLRITPSTIRNSALRGVIVNSNSDIYEPSEELLRRLGASVSLPREICSLYRVRRFAFNESIDEWQARGIGEIYAYPIFIAAV